MTFIDKKQIKDNFGQSALTYDQYAKIQKKMALELLNRIRAIGKDFRDILEIGCGTGYLTELLVKYFPTANILAVDISPQMIEVARDKLAACPRVSYLIEDGENLSIDRTFDLVVSSAVFQWFNNYTQPFIKYQRLLRDDGYFIFNTLGKESYQELSQSLKAMGMEPPRPAFITLGELAEVLNHCGFDKVKVEEQLLKDYYASTRELLVGIKKIGAQSHCFNFSGAYLREGDIFKLVNVYNTRFRQGDHVYATYHILYGKASKGSS